MSIFALRFAGIILFLIGTANFYAPQKMRWSMNLAKTEPIFRQVFIVHCIFLVATVFGMSFLCLLKPELLIEEILGKFLLGFMALFWGARLLIQIFYYDRDIKRAHPVFNLMFTVAFAYLTIVLTCLAINF